MPIFDHSHPKTSNNKDDWNPVKYLNVLHHNRTQKQLQYFFLISFKNLTASFFGYFGHVWLLSSKIDNPTCGSFDLDELQNNSIHNLFSEILSKHCRLVTLSTLRMLDHSHHHALHVFMIMPITF